MNKFQANNIIQVEVAKIKPFKNNTRKHDKSQIEQIALSIREFGFTKPVLITGKNILVAGEGAWRAAMLLKMATIPCVVMDHLSPTQLRALVIADNKLAENSTWDHGKLAEEFDSLLKDNFDLGLLGFDEDFVENILRMDIVPDNIPAAIVSSEKTDPVAVTAHNREHRTVKKCPHCGEVLTED